MLWLLPTALAAPPTAKAEVDALLSELYSPDSATRLRAANDLAQTPPSLVGHLAPTELPCWKGERDLESPACRYHNHALYHLIRVLGALADKSVRLDNAYGQDCHARGLANQGPCPALDALRWTASNQFTGFVALEDEALPEGSPPETKAQALEREAGRLLDRALERPPDPGAWSKALTAEAPGLRWSALPRCAGPGMYPICAWHLSLEKPGQPVDLLVHRKLGAPVHATRQELRLTPDGKYGLFLSFGGCCGDDRLHVTVFELVFELGQKQAPVCSIVYAGGESMPPEQVHALVAGMIVEDGVCRPPSTPAGAQIEGIK